MFPARFFCNRMFAPRYFAKVGDTAVPPTPPDAWRALSSMSSTSGGGQMED